MANITVNDATLLQICSNFLDPFARLLGLDGTILLSFIIGFPANEIVLPLTIMGYMAQGHLTTLASLSEIKELLLLHDWTWLTALCMMLFSLFHWPCSTTLLTIKKETYRLKWTLLAFLLPTFIGIIICMFTAFLGRFFL